jgi:hypothetical protein
MKTDFSSSRRAPAIVTSAPRRSPAWNGYRLTVARSCGVVFEGWVTPLAAALNMLGWRR